MSTRPFALLATLLLTACSSEPAPAERADAALPDVASDGGPDSETLDAADVSVDALPDAHGDTDASLDADVRDLGLPACEPALELSPAAITLAPLQLVQLVPTGGTGAYRVLLTDNQTSSVFTIGERRYIAGNTSGTDTITMTDSGCEGIATAEFTVVEPPTVTPSNLTVRPGASFVFELSGGSGNYSSEFVSNRTGATMADDQLTYTAGTRETFDTIRFTDNATERSTLATITVNIHAELVLETPRVALPVGGIYEIHVESGSGRLVTAGDVAPWLAIENGRIEGLAPGEWTQILRDPFSGLTAELEIDVVQPLEGDFALAGNQQTSSSVRALGDINGDGFADVAVAIAEADVDAYNSGAVFIYMGGDDGFSGVPAQTLSGETFEEEFGRGMAFADVNGDGVGELIIGAANADIGGTNIGAVYFFELGPDGLFQEEPSATLVGVNNFDRFGINLTTCDFDGDGVQDLAVGANSAEDRDAPVRANSQGAVHVYRGEEGEFPVAPTRTLYGELPGSGRWQYRANMQMGFRLTAGDFDGDGACDIAAGAYPVSIEGTGADGAVVLYRGILRSVSEELVSPRPSLALAATEPADDSMNFGRALAAGDLDNDGVDELIVGAYAHNGPGGNDTGGVFVYQWAGTLPYSEELTPMQEATWRYEGTNSGYYVGGWVSVDDANGDGIDDLISGNWRGDIDSEDELTRPGSVDVFFGLDGALPDFTPSFSVQGIASETFFGEGASAFGDADGDGEMNFMVVAGRFDDDGADYPQAFHFNGMDSPTVRRAVLPAVGSGFDFGRGVALVEDVTGDGRPDIVAGAPLAPTLGLGSQVGEVLIYAGSEDAISTEPSQRIRGFQGHSTGDRAGWNVSGGDFDGDGNPDLFIVNRSDDMPGSFGTSYHNPFGCSGSRNNSASVSIFLGRPGEGLATEPDFVFYPEQSNTPVDDIAVADIDDDGRDDIILGASLLDRESTANCGGILLLRGRRYVGAGLTTVLCQSDTRIYGANADDRLGTSVASAGDLDADGCADVLVGAPRENLGVGNQGTVRVLYGSGAACSTIQTRVALVSSGRANSQAGFAVDGGQDIDGDRVPDVIVGGPFYREGNAVPGGAWLLSGQKIVDLPTSLVSDGIFPDDNAASFTAVGVDGNFGLRGRTTDEEFGLAVALVPDLDGDGRGEVAIGAPRADYAGSGRTGAVSVYAFVPGEGLSDRPILIFSGEIGPPEGRVGEILAAGPVGLRVVLIVGGPRGSSLGLQSGSVYVIPL